MPAPPEGVWEHPPGRSPNQTLVAALLWAFALLAGPLAALLAYGDLQAAAAHETDAGLFTVLVFGPLLVLSLAAAVTATVLWIVWGHRQADAAGRTPQR